MIFTFITTFEIDKKPPPVALPDDPIWSISGSILSYCNENQSIKHVLNPDVNTLGVLSRTIGVAARVFLRFSIGLTAGVIGGASGTLWHSGRAIVAGAYYRQANECKSHIKCALADLARLLLFGISSAYAYTLAPNIYSSKTEKVTPFEKEMMLFSEFLFVYLVTTFLFNLSSFVIRQISHS